ncbi:hypothetical protein Vretimale_8535, partial [Volvox reticuliferus]
AASRSSSCCSHSSATAPSAASASSTTSACSAISASYIAWKYASSTSIISVPSNSRGGRSRTTASIAFIAITRQLPPFVTAAAPAAPTTSPAPPSACPDAAISPPPLPLSTVTSAGLFLTSTDALNCNSASPG